MKFRCLPLKGFSPSVYSISDSFPLMCKALLHELKLLPQAYWHNFHACLSESLAVFFQRMCILSLVLEIWIEQKSSVPPGRGSAGICCSSFTLHALFWARHCNCLLSVSPLLLFQWREQIWAFLRALSSRAEAQAHPQRHHANGSWHCLSPSSRALIAINKMLYSSNMMSLVLTSVISVSALVNDWFSFFFL